MNAPTTSVEPIPFIKIPNPFRKKTCPEILNLVVKLQNRLDFLEPRVENFTSVFNTLNDTWLPNLEDLTSKTQDFNNTASLALYAADANVAKCEIQVTKAQREVKLSEEAESQVEKELLAEEAEESAAENAIITAEAVIEADEASKATTAAADTAATVADSAAAVDTTAKIILDGIAAAELGLNPFADAAAVAATSLSIFADTAAVAASAIAVTADAAEAFEAGALLTAEAAAVSAEAAEASASAAVAFFEGEEGAAELVKDAAIARAAKADELLGKAKQQQVEAKDAFKESDNTASLADSALKYLTIGTNITSVLVSLAVDYMDITQDRLSNEIDLCNSCSS